MGGDISAGDTKVEIVRLQADLTAYWTKYLLVDVSTQTTGCSVWDLM